MKFLRVFTVSVAMMCCIAPAFSAPGMSTASDQASINSDPVVLLQHVSDQLIEGLSSHKTDLKSDPKIVTDLVEEVVLPHIDRTTMIKIVLGRSGYQDWKKASPQTQSNFETAFTNLIIGTYVSALQAFDNESVKVYPPRKPITTQTRVRLQAKIFSKSAAPVRMTYVMSLEGVEWKIIDFSVEGISLIQSYQSQFQSILSNGGGLEHLVSTLEQHNEST